MDLEITTRETEPVPPISSATFAETLVDFGFSDAGAHSADDLTAPLIRELTSPRGIIHFAFQKNVTQASDLLLTRLLDLSPELSASRADTALDNGLMALASDADPLVRGVVTVGRNRRHGHPDRDPARDLRGLQSRRRARRASGTLVSQTNGTLLACGILIDGEQAENLLGSFEDAADDRGCGASEDDGEDDADHAFQDTASEDHNIASVTRDGASAAATC